MADMQLFTQAERDEIIAKIRAGLVEGKRASVTAAELGISESTFYRWLREKARGSGASEAKARSPQRGMGYAPSEKARLITAVERRIARGEKAVAAAQAVGLASSTYYAWMRERRVNAAPLMLRPVTVVAAEPNRPAASGGLTLVAPGGYRLEGLDVASAAALLRSLPC